jgi:hypothetical protein
MLCVSIFLPPMEIVRRSAPRPIEATANRAVITPDSTIASRTNVSATSTSPKGAMLAFGSGFVGPSLGSLPSDVDLKARQRRGYHDRSVACTYNASAPVEAEKSTHPVSSGTGASGRPLRCKLRGSQPGRRSDDCTLTLTSSINLFRSRSSHGGHFPAIRYSAAAR